MHHLTLEPEEQIIFTVRRHWLILGVEVLGILIIAFLPPILYASVGSSISIPFSFSYLSPIYFVWLIMLWMLVSNIWTNYYLDVWTLTNKRLVVTDQQGFFNRSTASFRLERLQDVQVSVHGIIATLLKFGTLEIQTAGEQSNFKAYGLPHPEILKTQVLEAAGNLRDMDGGV